MGLQILPAFHDNVGQILSADLALNKLRANAALLDGLSFRKVPAVDNAAGPGYNVPNAPGYTTPNGPYKEGPTFRAWKGFFRWRTGITTLTVYWYTSMPSGVTLRIYLDGVATGAPIPYSPPGDGRNIDISSGYTDGQIVNLEVQVQGSGTTTSSTFWVGAYISPIVKSGWPGVPTFTTATINASKLNQLYSAEQWLYDRIALCPLIPQRAMYQMLGTQNSAAANGGDPRTLWTGHITKNYSNDILVVSGYYTNFLLPAMFYRIFLNESLVATGATHGAGTWGVYETISLASLAVGDVGRVLVQSAANTSSPAYYSFSRWTLWEVTTEAAGYNYGYATLPAAFAYGSMSPATLVSALNSLCTIVSNAKARIDASPAFSRVNVQHWSYGYGDTDAMANKRGPIKLYRRGDRLIVSGKDVHLSWGAATFPARDNGTLDYDNYTFPNNEQLIEGNKADTKEVFLDAYPGLYQNQLIYVTGDVQYVEELYS